MAEGLAEAGASLMLLARREQWLTPPSRSFATAASGVKHAVRRCKHRRRSSPSVDRTIETYGKIDILINNRV